MILKIVLGDKMKKRNKALTISIIIILLLIIVGILIGKNIHEKMLKLKKKKTTKLLIKN